jgi:hypothetical protein
LVVAKIATLMESPQVQALQRRLVGHRLRIDERAWVVRAVQLIDRDRLQIDVSGERAFTFAVDLPGGFDPGSVEHMAWLLAHLEFAIGSRANP